MKRVTYTTRYYGNGHLRPQPFPRTKVMREVSAPLYPRRCVSCGTEIDTETPAFADDVSFIHRSCAEKVEDWTPRSRAERAKALRKVIRVDPQVERALRELCAKHGVHHYNEALRIELGLED